MKRKATIRKATTGVAVTRLFSLGLIINPLAGIGGPAGLKGSDGDDIVSRALARGSRLRAAERAVVALGCLADYRERLQIVTYPGPMGEDCALAAGFTPEVIGHIDPDATTAADTEAAARAMRERDVDLLVFAGGDGTARNICNAVGTEQAALGIPCGVKMHSGVYAISPSAAGQVIGLLLEGRLVNITAQEVRDIDEDAFRNGIVKARYYGELLVPEEGRFVQQVKSGGREVEELVLADIAAELIEELEPETLYIVGPGTTTRTFMEELGLDNTLLGVDVILNQQQLAKDISGPELEQLVAGHSEAVKAIITPIGGQGHIIGRGNQQLTPEVLRRLGKNNLKVVATKTKMGELQGRPLLVDSNDPELDRALSGYLPVICGYRDTIFYPVGYGTNE